MSSPDCVLNAEGLLAALPDCLLHLAADGRLLASYGGGELADAVFAAFQKSLSLVAEETLSTLLAAPFEFSLMAEDGRERLLEAKCTLLDDGSRLCLLRDITSRHEAALPMFGVAAGVNALTGLPEKLRLCELINSEIGRSRREGHSLALLSIELDGLADIAGRYGQPIGALMLQWAVGRLRTTLRATDQLGWHGAQVTDEMMPSGGFMLLLPALARPEDALIVAERTVELLQRPFVFEGQPHSLLARIGIAICPCDGHDALSLWRQAAAACRLAAQSERRCRYADETLDNAARQRLTLVTDLRAALNEGGLTLAYQPRIEGGCVVAVEALLRWPAGGQLRRPDEFLSLADQGGFMPAIGRQALAQACADLARWRRAAGGRPPVLAFNLSAAELHDAGLPAYIATTLAAHGLSPQVLHLEVAEETLSALDDAGLERLRALRMSGFGLIIDRCLGHLALLATLPPGMLTGINISQRLIADLEVRPIALSIVGAMQHLARGPGLSVTAVGVERAMQARMLKDIGCYRQQGHLLCPPLLADEFFNWLQAQPVIGE